MIHRPESIGGRRIGRRGVATRYVERMDISWLAGIFVLLIVLTGISITGALRRIADATEKTAADVELLLQEVRKADQPQ